MRNIILILIIIVLSSCSSDGEYQYVINMKDGTKVYAWSVSSSGGGLFVVLPHGTGGYYYLSSNEYSKAEYVGVKNINK